MAEETLQEAVARLYRDMTPEAIAKHERWVRRFKAEQALKEDHRLIPLEDWEEKWVSDLLNMTPLQIQEISGGERLDFTGRGNVLAHLLTLAREG